MATKNYMINDKWLDLDKQNIVELQSVDGVLDRMKVNGSEIVTPSGKITITENGTDIDVAQYALADVNVESDFSFAQVTITGGEGEAGIQMVRIEEGEFVYNTFQEFPAICHCILYQGSQTNICLVDSNGDNYPGSALTITGNIVIDDAEFGYMTVTGDGTITISAE